MKKINNKITFTIINLFVIISLLSSNKVSAATTPFLGETASYTILSSTYTNTVPGTTVTGDIGFTTPPAVIPAGVHANYGSGAPYSTAGTDQGNLLTSLASQPCTFTFPDTDIDLATDVSHGTIGVYTPGVYCTQATRAASIGTAGITLSGAGTYIFRVNGALTTVMNSVVTLDGASACDVFWTPTEATTLGANSTFKGNNIDASGITVGGVVNWVGRALSFGGTVTTSVDDVLTLPTSCTLPATLHVIKQVVNTGGGMATSSDFTLHVASGTPAVDVSGSPQLGTTTPGTSYLLVAGSYTVSEPATTTYTQSFSADCPSGVVTLAPNDNKTCMVTNTYNIPMGTLHVIKQVVNTGGGTATSSDFTLHVASGTPLVDVSGSPQLGTTTPGTTYILTPDSYTVSEPATTTYTQSFSADCPSGVVTLASGDNKTCTVTNTYIIPPPVITSSGGSYFLYIKPSIKIVKVPTPLSLLNGPGIVVYDYYVSNTGINAMSNVTVTDNKCSTIKFISGDVNGDTKLNITEIWRYSCTMILPETTTNIATASGYADSFTVTDTTNATVVVSTPLVATATPMVLGASTTTLPVVITTYPTLPNAGYGPDEKTIPWNMIVVVGFVAVSVLLFTTKKEKINM